MGKKYPHRAVYSLGLNLLSQDGPRLESSALAQAYRVTFARLESHKWVLAQAPECYNTDTAGYLSYTMKGSG